MRPGCLQLFTTYVGRSASAMADEPSEEIELVYLTLDDVLELYGLMIGGTAAQAADQLRNRDGLAGAIARPGTYAHYENADLAFQAARPRYR